MKHQTKSILRHRMGLEWAESRWPGPPKKGKGVNLYSASRVQRL